MPGVPGKAAKRGLSQPDKNHGWNAITLGLGLEGSGNTHMPIPTKTQTCFVTGFSLRGPSRPYRAQGRQGQPAARAAANFRCPGWHGSVSMETAQAGPQLR